MEPWDLIRWCCAIAVSSIAILVAVVVLGIVLHVILLVWEELPKP